MRTSPTFALLAALVAAATTSVAAPSGPRPSPEDVASLAVASDLRLSPDGRSLLYALAVQTLDPAAKPSDDDTQAGWTRARQLWLADVASGATRRLTAGRERSGSPRWSPDGSAIAFLREVEGKTRIHVMPVDGGEPEVVDTGDLEPTSLEWSPDGRSLGFTAAEPPSRAEKDAKWKTGGVIEWDAEWRPSEVHVVPRAGGEARRITREPGHVAEWTWSPDGTRLAVLTSASADPYLATSERTARVVSTRDGRVVRTIEREFGDLRHPRWSPDGRQVAFLAVREGLSLTNALIVCDADGPGTRNVSPSNDPTFATFEWAPDGRALIAVVKERTTTELWRVPAGGGAPERMGFAGRVIDGDLAVDAGGGRLAFLSSTDTEPPDPTVFDPAAGTTRVLVRLNPQVVHWSLGATEVVRWTGPEGTPLEGLLTMPPRTLPGTLPPLMVFPHGGPDDVTSRRFHAFTQFFAAHGYAVFRPNYRGGLGYGHAFYAANRNRFGEIESMDIESGVDALIAARRVDPRELFFGGWSWGGYIGAWTLGHTTRYRAFVVGAGVNDVVLSYALSDINHGAAAQWEYRGDPWRETEHFDRANPIRSIAGAKTPTLILHGREDTRVPFAQSILLYRALRDVGCPVRFLAYPREDHGLVEPAHLAHRLAVWLDWYERRRASMVTSPPPTRALMQLLETRPRPREPGHGPGRKGR